jgi:Tfp pilus assembly protein PilE
MGQILKKIIILAVVASLGYAGYMAWTKFIKKTGKHTKAAAVNRAKAQGIDVKK